MVSKGTPFIVSFSSRDAPTVRLYLIRNLNSMKSKLIKRLKDSRQELVNALETISPDTGITEEWTTKEVLAHIAGWDEVSAEAIQKLAAGKEPQVTVPQGIKAFNSEMAKTWAEKDYQQALFDFTNSREQFVAAIEALPDNLVNSKFTLPWGGKGSIAQIVEILADHEIEHGEDLHLKAE